jgi:hypothetical protein
MHEVYFISKQQNPEKLLEFSKFAELHPKNCLLQPVILMKLTISGHLYALTQVEENPVKPSASYAHNKDFKYGC